jgi:hypothetical protein
MAKGALAQTQTRPPGALDAAHVWRQAEIPVVFCDTAGKRLLVKMPYAHDNRAWLKDEHVRRPEWLKQFTCWRVPRAWLDELTQRLCEHYGQVYVIHPYREREVCAPACWDAQGVECTCSCLGANHGQGSGGGAWYIVSETCAIQWGPRRYACRLLMAPWMYQQERNAV